MKREKNQINGWLNINKPVGVSSTFVTNSLKRLLNPKKIGHAGTLDPAACGVLNIALGEATKTIEYVQDRQKTYRFTVKFGETTDTLDLEGKVIEKNDILPNLKQIEAAIPNFIGRIKQTPPQYSALKINGKRAYDLARQGIEFEMKEREIEVYGLRLLEYSDPQKDDKIATATFECECSKGTYIRTLAADIAIECGTIGFVIFLQRTRVGNFALEDSFNYNKDLPLDVNTVISCLKPIDAGLDDIPVLHLDSASCKKLRDGLKIPTENSEGLFKIYHNENLFALGLAEEGNLKTVKVFNL